MIIGPKLHHRVRDMACSSGLFLFLSISACGCEGHDRTASDETSPGVSTGDDSERATDTASESESADPPSSDDGGVICDGDCLSRAWTTCSCGVGDPCGWSGDGFCDGYCIERLIVEEMFDDSEDCQGKCTGLCQRGVYTRCTCSREDPCGWAGDGTCDDSCLTSGIVDEMFEDVEDCSGNP